MKNKFDLIIFDWDGTLVNSIDWITICLQQAAGQCGITVPEDQAAKNVIGLSLNQAMQNLFPGIDPATQAQLVAYYSQHYNSKKISPNDLFPGVYDMLVQLKQSGYQLAVATGKSRAGLQKALEGTGTEALFCVTRCADETASKPDPRMLHEILQHTNTAKERSLMVGDLYMTCKWRLMPLCLLLVCPVAQTQQNFCNNIIRYCVCNSQLNY